MGLAALALLLSAQAPQLTLEPCQVSGLEGAARCGRLLVRENRKARSGRRIPLEIVVVPANGPERRADPVVVISGGPGQSAVRDVARVSEELKAQRAHRDLVFVDQRGTGGSNALRCVPFGEADWRLYFGTLEPGHVRDCRQRLSKQADLSRYTTDEAVEDLEEVRRALGFDRVNLDAGSYGTRVAFVYMQRYPARVRTAVLKGLNAPSLRIPLPFARAGQDALERLFADCAADAGCAGAFPRLREEFGAVLARLERAPAKLTITNPATGQPLTVEIGRAAFASRVHLLLFSSRLAARLPLLVHQAHEGDWVGFAELAAAFGKAIVDQIDFGMQLSVLCAEDLPFIGEAELDRETRGTFLGPERVRSAKRNCREWPRGRPAPEVRQPVRSDVPTLLVSGAFDPATPPRFAEEAAAGLRRSRHVVFQGSHIDGQACTSAMAAAFVEAGSPEGLDTSCVSQVRRPPFELPGTN
jgi:pimeloyl-ACP methyl ester carboxylesterase